MTALPRDDRSEFRVSFQQDRKGKWFLDLRVFEEFAGPSKVRTGTGRGLSLPLDRVADLEHALTMARVLLLEQGLLRDGS